MKILYIAYSCSPFHGSEDKIGWNIPAECAKRNQVIVLTKEEQREYIEKYLRDFPLANIRFVYVDIPSVYKKLFRGPLYSGRLNIWNSYAYQAAKEICAKENVDIIHQITPVEFRSIGNFAKIPHIKFVCGPIAGGQRTPKALKPYARQYAAVEIIRAAVNAGTRVLYFLSGKLNRCSHIFMANRETWEYLNHKKTLRCRQSLLTDVCIDRKDLIAQPRTGTNPNRKCIFLVVGRLVYLKGHAFLLDALKGIPAEMEYECRIVGDGPELDALKQKCMEDRLTDKIKFLGRVDYAEIAGIYRQADVLIMPSLREATGSVLLEAMANGLPVVTINRFGGAGILDDRTGWLYDAESQQACVDMLRAALISCITQPDEVVRRGNNARKEAEKYTWEERVKHYEAIYTDVISSIDA